MWNIKLNEFLSIFYILIFTVLQILSFFFWLLIVRSLQCSASCEMLKNVLIFHCKGTWLTNQFIWTWYFNREYFLFFLWINELTIHQSSSTELNIRKQVLKLHSYLLSISKRLTKNCFLLLLAITAVNSHHLQLQTDNSYSALCK